MTRAIQLIAVLLIILVFAGGFWYISGLRASLAVSEENSKKLSNAVAEQQATIKQIQEDQKAISKANEQLASVVSKQSKDMAALGDKFNTTSGGKPRDIGADAVRKPALIERVINKGTKEAFRCIEIASGSALNKDETNSLCPSYMETK